MPKLKTNKAAKKRYSYTATGKVKENIPIKALAQAQKELYNTHMHSKERTAQAAPGTFEGSHHEQSHHPRPLR